MRFWDSSALVPLLVKQAASRSVQALHKSDSRIVAWWGRVVECVSAIQRLERDGQLSTSASSDAFLRLEALRQSWQEVPPVEVLRDTALRLLRVHRLRASDAMQLAAAFVAAEHRPSTLEFVCLDERLSEAAQREGFPLAKQPRA